MEEEDSCLDGQRLFDKAAPQRGTLEYVDYAKECEYPFPSYWKTRHSKVEKNPPLVTTGPRSGEAIKNLVVQSWKPDQVGRGRDARGLKKCRIEVVSVDRLENPQLFSGYFQERKNMFEKCSARRELCGDMEKLPGSKGRTFPSHTLPSFMKGELYWEVNEHYLFHGTKPDTLQSVLSRGLDPSYSSSTSMFGQAVYTAECFTKADQYTDPKDARSDLGTDLYMILARVLLGRVYVCNTRAQTVNLDSPPCSSCQVNNCECPSPLKYDSVMADGDWMFREFAKHHKNRCYPEYVIKYKRNQESSSPSSSTLSSSEWPSCIVL